MKIIKPGKQKTKMIEFTCLHCKCEFECDETEYYTVQSVTSLSYPPSVTVVASCPSCHKICKAYKKQETSDIYISTTYCDSANDWEYKNGNK